MLVNFSGREEKLYKDIDVSGYELLISNTDTPAVIRLNSLKPYEALVYYKRDRI